MAGFATRAWNFVFQKKREIFFAGVAAFALGSVVQRELASKGIVQQAKPLDPRPKVDRTFGKGSKSAASDQ
jgi:hypothetical protein